MGQSETVARVEVGRCAVSGGNHSIDVASEQDAVYILHSGPGLSQGPHDAYCRQLTIDRTIERTDSGPVCVYCGHVRMFNAIECLHCKYRRRRRLARLVVGLLMIVGLAASAAVLVEPIPGPRTTLDGSP